MKQFLPASLIFIIVAPSAVWAEPAPDPASDPGQSPRTCRVISSSGDVFCREGNRWLLQPRPEGSRPANAAPTPPAPALTPGEAFPVAQHSMLMDIKRYGLPPVDGPWRYYLLNGIVYRVSALDSSILAVVGPAHDRRRSQP